VGALIARGSQPIKGNCALLVKEEITRKTNNEKKVKTSM
jgi:hypothetical protein